MSKDLDNVFEKMKGMLKSDNMELKVIEGGKCKFEPPNDPAKTEQIKQKLDIAVKALEQVAVYMTCDEKFMKEELDRDFCADQAALDTVNEALAKIKGE